MNIRSPFANMSLQWKLVLSYLGVALGAILALGLINSYTVNILVQKEQKSQLHNLAQTYENSITSSIDPTGRLDYPRLIGMLYPKHGGPGEIAMLVINDASGQRQLCAPQQELAMNQNCENPIVQQSLNQAAQLQQQPPDQQQSPGQLPSPYQPQPPMDVEGTMNVVTLNGDTLSAPYLAEPLHYHGQIIGTIFVLQAPTSDFLGAITRNIFLAGFLIAVIVGLFSIGFAHNFTRPITRLTRAAERLKRGQYAERVPASTSQDELGMLAQTFNEMATQIEADVNELRNQDLVRRELIANIAHDLATPLTAIQGFSEAMADNMLPDLQAQQETAQRIGREVQRLRRLVADMQNMTAIESGRLRLDLAPLDVHSLVDETLAVIAPECENKGITLLNQTNRSTPLVMADSDRITQVLLNLLDNARRHTPEGGIITVNAAPRGQELCVWVSDTGRGIDAKDLPHIFERFYRADRSRAASTGGSGLGLAIVKAIITAHGGKIWAQSTLGKGTTIAFTLPLIKAPEQTTHPLSQPGLQKTRP